MFNSLKRVIGLGWQNLTRDGGIAVGNVFIIMIPVILTSSLFMLKDVSAFLVKEIQAMADISVSFNESVSEDDIMKVKDLIKAIPGINQVDYKSKDQAMEEFSKRHEDDPILLESLQEVNGNPFPAVLNISAASVGQYAQVQELLAGQDYVDMIDKIDYNEEKKRDSIDKIFSLTDGAQRIGLILFAILGVISVIVTFNTVRMAIQSRGVEVGIQRLVGASRWFVRGQFLVEGLIFGVLAAVFSLLTTAVVCWYLNPPMATLLSGMSIWQNFTANMWPLFGFQLGIGAGLGIFSSLIAVGRHLKV
jgi:cell division transport system permease protein